MKKEEAAGRQGDIEWRLRGIFSGAGTSPEKVGAGLEAEVPVGKSRDGFDEGGGDAGGAELDVLGPNACDGLAGRVEDGVGKKYLGKALDAAEGSILAGGQFRGEKVDGRRAEEGGGEEIFGSMVEFRGGASLLEAPFAKEGDAVAEGHGFSLVMGDVNEGNGELALEGFDFGAEFLAGGGIEIGERFIKEKEPGAEDEGAGESRPLLLSARELLGIALEERLEL